MHWRAFFASVESFWDCARLLRIFPADASCLTAISEVRKAVIYPDFTAPTTKQLSSLDQEAKNLGFWKVVCAGIQGVRPFGSLYPSVVHCAR